MRIHNNMCLPVLTMFTVLVWVSWPVLPAPAATRPGQLSPSVFLPERADEARATAQRYCKPLVVHVLSDSQLGVEQLYNYYGSLSGVSPAVLERVVIAVIPRERYAGFARQLGISDAGGLRTISPYELNTLDAQSVTTCRAGFI
jgi:hypothetical protein